MIKSKYHQYETDEHASNDLRLVVAGMCLLTCLLFALTICIDIQAEQGRIAIPGWVSVGNIDDARALIGAIIGSVSTVLGLVFSVVLLVLSMASGQFGPRLLRRFTLEHTGQGTIGLFSGTFLFSLFTLVAMHVENGHAFVPQITLLVAVILMIVSFGALILFSQSIRKGIQVGNLIANVTRDMSHAINTYIGVIDAREKNYTRIVPAEEHQALHVRCIQEGFPVLANLSGYLQQIKNTRLLSDASENDVVIALAVRPGHFIIANTIIAYVLPKEKGMLLMDRINESFSIGPNRTLTHDPAFALAQIVEIGIRALSPAINDTFTGLTCIDWLSSNILSLVEIPDDLSSWQDHNGFIRLIETPIQFSKLISGAFDMMRESGSGIPPVLMRLLQNFIQIGPHLKNNMQRMAIRRQVIAIKECFDLQSFTITDLNELQSAYENAMAALEGTST